MGLTNNDIIKKLRVALKLTDEDIVKICALVDFKVTKAELGGFFRKEGHPKYVELHDQILRNFLDGLIVHKRGPRKFEPKVDPNRTRSTHNPRYKKSREEIEDDRRQDRQVEREQRENRYHKKRERNSYDKRDFRKNDSEDGSQKDKGSSLDDIPLIS